MGDHLSIFSKKQSFIGTLLQIPPPQHECFVGENSPSIPPLRHEMSRKTRLQILPPQHKILWEKTTFKPLPATRNDVEKNLPSNPPPQHEMSRKTHLQTPPPQHEMLWGRIKEGAEKADLTEKSRWGFIALPLIPSRTAGGELCVDSPISWEGRW